jgi:hypothetical protein
VTVASGDTREVDVMRADVFREPQDMSSAVLDKVHSIRCTESPLVSRERETEREFREGGTGKDSNLCAIDNKSAITVWFIISSRIRTSISGRAESGVIEKQTIRRGDFDFLFHSLWDRARGREEGGGKEERKCEGEG